jgi:hypothetical protein
MQSNPNTQKPKEANIMSQNNMVNFITLTDPEGDKVELNPAFITMMRRDTYEPEDGIEIPMTAIYTSWGYKMFSMETPEEVVKLQMDGIQNMMKSIVESNMAIIENMGSGLDIASLLEGDED